MQWLVLLRLAVQVVVLVFILSRCAALLLLSQETCDEVATLACV